MTRVRVLQEARRIILNGYLPHHKMTEAFDGAGNSVSCLHPDAVQFSLFSAIKRAVRNLTEDTHHTRPYLYEQAADPIYAQFPTIGATLDFLATASVEEVVALIDKVLEGF